MKSLINQYSKEELEQVVQQSSSYNELLRKLGYTYTSGTNHKMVKEYLEKYNINVEHFTNLPKDRIKRTEENVFIQNSTASQSTLRKMYFDGQYTEYKCALCGIKEWNGKGLTLRLDHINGYNNDDRLENLRWVCPNCDSQLETFCRGHKIFLKKKYYCIDCGAEISSGGERCLLCCAKNRQTVERPTREELKNLIRTTPFTQIAEMYNVTDNAIRKWCDAENLPRKKNEIKKYSDEEWEKI